VLVRAGTYANGFYIDANGTASAPITFEAYPGERPVLRPGSNRPQYGIEIVGSYIRVRGFVIEYAKAESSTNVYLENPSHHVEISGNELRFAQGQGIFVEGSTRDHQILGNDIHDNGLGHVSGQDQSHGIYVEGGNHLVANNVVHDQDFGFGIQVYPKNDGSIITGNTVFNNSHAGIVLGGSGGVRNVVVRNNIFAYNTREGIAHDDTCATQSVADHNVLFGNGYGPIESGCTGVDRSGGNRTTDPLFLNLAGLDLHIRLGSAAIDYGMAAWSPVTDRDGRGRTFGAAPDAGAYEFGG
jgi:parallel beta-helix repeat protein